MGTGQMEHPGAELERAIGAFVSIRTNPPRRKDASVTTLAGPHVGADASGAAHHPRLLKFDVQPDRPEQHWLIIERLCAAFRAAVETGNPMLQF